MLFESLTKGAVTGDVLKAEGDPIITRETKKMTNPHTAGFVFPPGYPMDDNVPVLASGLAGVDGMLLTPAPLATGEVMQVAVLARGPAAYNVDALPTKDYAGTAFNMATLQAAFDALVLVVPRQEPDTTELQTT